VTPARDAGILALDRFTVQPLADHKREIALGYAALVAVCLVSALAAASLRWWPLLRRLGQGADIGGNAGGGAKEDAAASAGADNLGVVTAFTLRWVLVFVRVAYAVFSLRVWRLSLASGWSLHYPIISNFGSVVLFNGLTFAQNLIVLASTVCLLLPCAIGANTKVSNIIMGMVHLCGMCVAFTNMKHDAETQISEWLTVKLIELQRRRLREICCTLLPNQMVDLVLEDRQQPSAASTQIIESKAAVLQLDLVRFSYSCSCSSYSCSYSCSSYSYSCSCSSYSFSCSCSSCSYSCSCSRSGQK